MTEQEVDGQPESLPSEIPLGDGVRRIRNRDGTFAVGNPGGPGHPHAGAAAKLRTALFRAVKAGNIKKIVAALVRRAETGDIQAARIVLGYTLGEPISLDIVERIERMEAVYVKSRG